MAATGGPSSTVGFVGRSEFSSNRNPWPAKTGSDNKLSAKSGLAPPKVLAANTESLHKGGIDTQLTWQPCCPTRFHQRSYFTSANKAVQQEESESVMYKIDKKSYGLHLTFSGHIPKDELEQWLAESREVIKSLSDEMECSARW
jgi:hypothetical protein